MEAVLRSVRQVACSDKTVIISGESGSRKERISPLIHRLSGRPGPFVALNSPTRAGHDPKIVLAGLFGVGSHHGLNNGPPVGRPRLFEPYHGGTVFLDEIHWVDGRTQAMLLRFLDKQPFAHLPPPAAQPCVERGDAAPTQVIP